jgi:hypothetical protein
MLYIKDNGEIHLTRGDSAYIEVPIVNKLADGTTEPYEVAVDDTLALSVKSSTDDTVYCFQKEVVGTNLFHIEPADTCECAFGKYKYDVQLTTAAGDVYTVIEPTCFKILPEVTN